MEWMAHISSYLRLFSSLRTNGNPKTFVQVKLGARTSYELTCTPSYVSAQSHFRFAKLQSMQTDAMPWSLLFSQTEQPNNLRHLFWRFFFLLISWRWWIFVIYWTTGSCTREIFCSFKWTPASFITIIWKKTLVSLVWFVYYECSLTIKLFIPVRRNVANASMFVLFYFFL